MRFELVVQKAVYDALNGSVSAPIYDDPPELPASMPKDSFPYVVIGDDIGVQANTDDTKGREVDVTLHIWSRYRGSKQVKEIAGEIEAILDRSELTADNYRFVYSNYEFFQLFTEDNGTMRHGVMRFSMFVHEDKWFLSEGTWGDDGTWTANGAWE